MVIPNVLLFFGHLFSSSPKRKKVRKRSLYSPSAICRATNTPEAAAAIPYLLERTHIPLVADIHFDYRLALAAADAGIHKIRINPGNIGSDERIRAVARKCREKGIPIYEYTPLQVKQSVVGYGRAEKKQVMEMVRRMLHLSEIPRPDDAADALAIALCHGRAATSLLFQAGEKGQCSTI